MTDKSITTATLKDIHIEQDITIQASPEDVFDAITKEISSWWSAPYFHVGATKRLVLEAKVGGRFYEDIGNDEGLLLATVMLIKRPGELRLMGPMGMAGPVQSFIVFQFEEKNDSTLLKLSHRMIGEVNEEIETAYSGGWHELLSTRLRNFVEHGTRYDGDSNALSGGTE